MKVNVLSLLLSAVFIFITVPNVAVYGNSITGESEENNVEFEPSELGTSLENKTENCTYKCGDSPGVKCFISNFYEEDELKCGCENDDKTYDESSKQCKAYDSSTPTPTITTSSTPRIDEEPETTSPDLWSRTMSHLRTTTDGSRKNFTTALLTSTPTSRPCYINVCKNGGLCRMENFNLKCYCVTPFRGKYCEKDPCSDQPCQNGGRCYPALDSFRCICKNTFSGKFCENDLCGQNPCKIDGFCQIEDKIPKWYCYVPYGEEVCNNSINSRIIIIFSAVSSTLAIALIACIFCHCIRHATKKQ